MRCRFHWLLSGDHIESTVLFTTCGEFKSPAMRLLKLPWSCWLAAAGGLLGASAQDQEDQNYKSIPVGDFPPLIQLAFVLALSQDLNCYGGQVY